jgi:outer membrane protein OmpA-like peptidoglycan-associated protein
MKLNSIKKGTLFVASALLVVGNLFAQGENLLSNGSFEATDGKVKKLGGIVSATGWESVTGVPADLFSESKIPDINVPMNKYGKETPKEGGNYAGIVAFSYGNKVPRSYLKVKLDTPMKKGMRYCVKFYVSLGEASKYASNNLGAHFSKKEIQVDQKVPYVVDKNVPVILHPNNDTEKLNQMFNWEQICGTFEADGGEKFMLIGNFYGDNVTKYETNKKPKDFSKEQVIAAYYYIDEVSVVMLENSERCDCVVEDKNEYSTMVYQKAIVLNDKMTSAQKLDAQQCFFSFGKTNFSPLGKESLDLIVTEMKANPAMRLEIMGHSDKEEDKVGAEKQDYADMASKRINAVVLYLTENGIEEGRLIPSPQGSEIQSEEIYEADEPDLIMAKNRRVTFKVR